MTDPIRLIAAMALSVFLGVASAQDDAGGEDKLYKWVDEDGNVTYQDTPPPDSGGRVETLADPDPAAEDTAGPEMPDVDVTFYSIDVCDACDLVRQLLSERGIPFEEKNAEGDVEVQNELREVAGALSVPVVQIGDEVFKGYNRELLLHALKQEGFPTSPGRGETQQAAGTGTGDGDQGATGSEAEASLEETATGAEDDFATTFDEDEIFAEDAGGGSGGDISEWEEIPEDERIQISQ